MKTSTAQKRASDKYKKENTYNRPVQFNKKDVPLELFEHYKTKLHTEEISYNRFVRCCLDKMDKIMPIVKEK